jgi:hypothetical protein
VSDQYLRTALATSKQRDIERMIAVKERRRQATAELHTVSVSPSPDPIGMASQEHIHRVISVASVWHALNRGLGVLVRRRAPA